MADQWEVRYSKSRSRAYFYNHSTQESLWDSPPGLTQKEIVSLPGFSQYLGEGTTSDQPIKPKSSDKVRCSHLLVKYDGSRRPSSWKSSVITRNKQEASDLIKGYRSQLDNSDDLQSAFAKVAGTESDCSSARAGGDLGWFAKGAMQKAFEEGTLATPIGSMSNAIWTDSGCHIIYRTG